ncbi:MAG: Ig-like domain-containing protein, partial [Paludibacteraceae bacterium]|nr:Ig-like domain-containing protein [Paludibacteraceae bacterium]
WTTQNGINGYKVVGPNGNSIFLPAAGYRNGTSIYEYGSYGRYWSSSLFLGGQADNMSFNSSIGPFGKTADRPLGLSVRPVLPKSLTLNKLSNTLFVDEEYTLIATCNGKEVVPEWTSSNESVAIVSGGVVKALSAGKTTISAKYNGKKVDCTIIVNNKLTILSVPDPAYVNMNYKLKVTYGGDTISNALWTSSNIAVASVANGVLTALSAGSSILTATYNGEKAECKIVVIEPEYVDLGLSVKWATCNVGAINPEDFGDYFAWGETTPKSEYSWRTYKYCNGTANSMTKYCTNAENGIVDNKTTLELIDDAANVNLGGDWRVPTYKELEELVNDCSWEWTDKNGVKGYMITGPNCNSIFLPAAGSYYDYSIEYNTWGPYGIYYSSSLSSNDSHIKMMKIRVNDESVFSGVTTWDDCSRDVGRTIRPVLP